MTQIKKQHKKDPIPEDASREEIAKFWDTHDLADYWDELEPVEVVFDKNLRENSLTDTLTVRLDPETLERLREDANKKGIGPTTLVRMMLKERYTAQATR